MIQRPLRSLVSSAHAVFAVAILAVSAACWLPSADAFAQASDAAATAAPSGQTYAVKPGQSLNDVAGDITGSKDRDVRQKMARQLFDANPGSFAGHDINKLKLGAVLNVPAADAGAASSAAVAASAPAVPQVASAPAQAEAGASAPVQGTAASESAALASAPAVQEASSAAAQPEAASEPAPAAVASAPVPVQATPETRTGPDPKIYGAAATLLVLLAMYFKWRTGKRAQQVAQNRATAMHPAAPRTFATLEEAQADADARNRALQEQRERETRANEAALERVNKPAPPADVAEPEAAAAVEPPAKPDPAPTAPPDDAFQPVAPAAHHPAFVPPLPHADSGHAPKPEAPPVHADETAAREALARDLHAREMQLRDAEARQASQEEVHAQLAREAAAREINAHGAELRAAQAEAAEHRDESAEDDEYRDDERSPAPRFPMPKFAQEAVQALGSLELGLPPRMELTLNLPGGTVTSHGMQPSEPERAPIDPAPFTPQPVAEHAGDGAVLHAPSVESEIEAGTAGAASVAGLGATQFPPLSMDFNAGLPKSQTEPLPAMTTAQLAAIARNKLELAGEYIELGDLPGARTLLQEVIAANDPATRQRAASLLSTLAPHA